MQDSMGINKLADMFMGNPQPLAQKVEQAQKQTPPGQIPPDLAEALALQQIQEAHQHAQNQQAMQAGGPQQTVMDKLRQLTGTVAQATPGTPPGVPPAQPQMPTVQAAHGGSIAHLVSNLGHHYGGGGIVAFSGKDESYVDDGPEWGSALRATRQAKEAEARKKLEEERARNMAQVNSPGTSEGRSAAVYRRDLMGATPAAESVGAPPAPAGLAQAAPAPAPVARPPVAQAPRPAAAPAQPGAAPAPQGLDALLESGIRGDLGRDRDAEAQKMVDKQREISGMSDYQKQMADMVTRRGAAQKEAQSNRTPEWVRGLQALGGAPVRGGLGMVLAQAGRGATAARDTYGEEDAKYATELDALRKASMDAQLKGNMELAKTYADQYKEVDAARRAAMQSGVGLQSNRNTVAQRAQADRHHQENLAESRAARAGTASDKATIDAYKVRLASIDRELAPLLKMPFGANKDTIATLQAEKARLTKAMDVATGIGTMSAAPGATSPGGTTTSGWGKAQVVK